MCKIYPQARKHFIVVAVGFFYLLAPCLEESQSRFTFLPDLQWPIKAVQVKLCYLHFATSCLNVFSFS